MEFDTHSNIPWEVWDANITVILDFSCFVRFLSDISQVFVLFPYRMTIPLTVYAYCFMYLSPKNSLLVTNGCKYHVNVIQYTI